MTDKPIAGFVSLSSMKRGPADSSTAIADIRRIYFATTRQTIDADFAHAIELLKSLETEEQREKASVFMEGLNEMRREWLAAEKRGTRKGTKKGPAKGAKKSAKTAAPEGSGKPRRPVSSK